MYWFGTGSEENGHDGLEDPGEDAGGRARAPMVGRTGAAGGCGPAGNEGGVVIHTGRVPSRSARRHRRSSAGRQTDACREPRRSSWRGMRGAGLPSDLHPQRHQGRSTDSADLMKIHAASATAGPSPPTSRASLHLGGRAGSPSCCDLVGSAGGGTDDFLKLPPTALPTATAGKARMPYARGRSQAHSGTRHY